MLQHRGVSLRKVVAIRCARVRKGLGEGEGCGGAGECVGKRGFRFWDLLLQRSYFEKVSSGHPVVMCLLNTVRTVRHHVTEHKKTSSTCCSSVLLHRKKEKHPGISCSKNNFYILYFIYK